MDSNVLNNNLNNFRWNGKKKKLILSYIPLWRYMLNKDRNTYFIRHLFVTCSFGQHCKVSVPVVIYNAEPGLSIKNDAKTESSRKKALGKTKIEMGRYS
jgi:hypothetical protein